MTTRMSVALTRLTGSGSGVATDAEIIARSVADPSWFGVIYDRHADRILRYAHARLGATLAEDVLSETFLAAFRRRASYCAIRPDAGPWLFGISVRQISRHRRAEQRARAALARLPREAEDGDFDGRSDDRVTAQQLAPRIALAMSELSRDDRELLLLIAWAELSYEEAAEALGLTVSALRSRLHRIRFYEHRPGRVLHRGAGRGPGLGTGSQGLGHRHRADRREPDHGDGRLPPP